MSKNTTTSQPSKEAEKALHEVVNNEKSTIEIRGKKFKVGAIYNDTLDWITDILQNEKKANRVNAKCFAALYLNGYFSLRLFWWIVWRWFFYVKQYTDEDMAPYIAEVKKKVSTQSALYYVNTMSLTDIRTTTMAMTMEEAERFRRELSMANRGRQQ